MTDQARRWSAGSARNYTNALHNCWPESAPAPRITKDGSYDRRQADRSMIAGIGEIPLSELTVEHVEDLYASMIDGQDSGFRAAALAQALLHQGLDAAVAAGHMRTNPARAAVLPGPAEGEKVQLAALTPQTVEAVHQALAAYEAKPHVAKWGGGTRASDAWVILGGTGLRIGELLSLRIADVRLATRQIVVAATLTEDGRLTRQPRTKSGKRRVLTPGARAWEVIERRVLEAQEARLPASTPVLSGVRGGHWSPSGFRRTLKAALAEAGIRQAVMDDDGRLVRITSHAQRRTVATRIAELHGIESAARYLGHSSIRVTEAAYVRHSGEVPAEIAEGL
ncbi:site-specific integrase [Micrococcus terreus]|uniref:tyrosine-type recombinase/integrase n=1 Tax=Micrococcus terreus TaxID=574650 RepID=UPI0021A90F08|nr:site-specific integrase [Micrococcus terreus]MCT2088538.1 site-specific integrase [Micrococcus terreus]